jgi:hypothetical protein
MDIHVSDEKDSQIHSYPVNGDLGNAYKTHSNNLELVQKNSSFLNLSNLYSLRPIQAYLC